MKKIIILLLFKVAILNAQFTSLKSFSGNDYGGYGSLTYLNGKLYGTTSWGGANNGGYLYSINTDGTNFTNLHNFSGWSFPCGSLLHDNGVFYGMTSQGDGIYKINIDGTGYSVLHNFSSYNPNNGFNPHGSLIISGNVLYGMALKGGATAINGLQGSGIIFKINTDGTNFTILHSFVPGEDYPYGSLILKDNYLYGMSSSNGSNTNGGVIFKINVNGTGYTILYTFSGADGYTPNGNLILSDNILYGMTARGGNLNGSVRKGNVFKINIDGTGFQSIFNDLNGSIYYSWSYGSLVLVGNVLYGKSNRNIYSLNTDGSNYQWYNWGSYGYATNSFEPQENGNLVYGDGALFGCNRYGGVNDQGVVYKFVPTNLGVDSVDVSSEIKMYPNPANEQITIDCGNLFNGMSWTIKAVNMLGQEVFSDVVNTQQCVIPLESWGGKGVYFIKIYDASNSLLNTKKIILK
ncbi:MAG: T9SS type A sorting domain-containing protein [Flavobacteriaceae bacterium]|nr:MAG: T9SS type A sorting domain-containing protein [Flavobacteriaceae bacterium]